MSMRLEAFGGCQGVSGHEAAAALLRSLGSEGVAVVFEQPPAT